MDVLRFVCKPDALECFGHISETMVVCSALGCCARPEHRVCGSINVALQAAHCSLSEHAGTLHLSKFFPDADGPISFLLVKAQGLATSQMFGTLCNLADSQCMLLFLSLCQLLWGEHDEVLTPYLHGSSWKKRTLAIFCTSWTFS